MKLISLPANYNSLSSKDKARVRRMYVSLQEGLCWHCKSSLFEPPPKNILAKKITKSLFPMGFFRCNIHLHHSHKTGKTLGAVHSYCNAVLWEYHHE